MNEERNVNVSYIPSADYYPNRPVVETIVNEAGMESKSNKILKGYSDTYLYSKYPLYSKQLTTAIMQDPMIDKSTDAFADVIHDVKRTRVSDAIVKILKSNNTVLLDCDDPLPKSFKVFCAKDFRTNGKPTRIFIDCSGVITKAKTSSALICDEMKLVSYLVNGGMCMIYHCSFTDIERRSALVKNAAACFARCFTFIVDYLVKVSLQETNKAKTLYLSAMYFLVNQLGFDEGYATDMAKKIADISEREAQMLNLLVDKANRVSDTKLEPYENIKTFINVLREVMKFNKAKITIDNIIERWMTQYGVGTILGLEYFPAFSAMMTDCYVGAYLNNQRSIENVCKVEMIAYAKEVLGLLEMKIQ